MDRTVQNTFNAFYKAKTDDNMLDKEIMSALIQAQDFPAVQEAMFDIMDLFSKALHMEHVSDDEWQRLIEGAGNINKKYNNMIQVARINIAILNYLDRRDSNERRI